MNARPGGLPVFHIELPLRLAPTMHEFANLKHFVKAKLRQELDWLIVAAKQKWRAWEMGVLRAPQLPSGRAGKAKGGRRRGICLVRHTMREPDEISCDVLGGKLIIDRLVQANVLVDDSRKWLERVPIWMPAPPGEGKLVVDVFELPDPRPLVYPKARRPRAPRTKP